MLYYAPLLITAANSMTLNHILSTLQDIPLFYIYDASFVFARPTIELLFFFVPVRTFHHSFFLFSSIRVMRVRKILSLPLYILYHFTFFTITPN